MYVNAICRVGVLSVFIIFFFLVRGWNYNNPNPGIVLIKIYSVALCVSGTGGAPVS